MTILLQNTLGRGVALLPWHPGRAPRRGSWYGARPCRRVGACDDRQSELARRMTAVPSLTIADPDRTASASIAAGRRVLRAEADALLDLAGTLDARFERCVEMIAAIRGRVVVTGMGKSGHVGRKIAATLASTGTPALYVHPGEASHGDLGMITATDLGARAVELGRDAGARRHRRLHPARLDPAARDRRPVRQHARRHRRPRAGAAAPRRGLPDGPGADHLDHGDPGARRRARDRPARAPRLRHAGVQRAAPGRQPRQEAGPGRAAHALAATPCRFARCTRR